MDEVSPITLLGSYMDIGKKMDIMPDLSICKNNCNKIGYSTKHEAIKVISQCLERSRNRPDKLRAYECPRCRLWHITRQEKRS
jgi:hypothetical protein